MPGSDEQASIEGAKIKNVILEVQNRKQKYWKDGPAWVPRNAGHRWV